MWSEQDRVLLFWQGLGQRGAQGESVVAPTIGNRCYVGVVMSSRKLPPGYDGPRAIHPPDQVLQLIMALANFKVLSSECIQKCKNRLFILRPDQSLDQRIQRIGIGSMLDSLLRVLS